ncbi:dethiobiotin synthase [Arachidicoccus ginsenosidimutans]|uniref:dethiobiotin synthase n=1 Tax=Arachidicoccus sp. BS20 TaxID=1850526 RepID=UPI0007F150AC|nr:dethiobiotin synthase [Arachidicoccus sp. BS20]ANI87851.1 dethiobiotin synthase [Arachidicoccus sp. BS20]
MSKKIAILGIHTDAGKTVTSAIMTEALKADYWKPVQAGDLENSDSIKIKRWISNEQSVIHDEAIKLLMPASPHTAAAHENRKYNFKEFQIPQTENLLLIETAGGIYSPMDDENTMLDFVEYFGWETVLVCRNYLGSINHTLLSLEALKHRNIKVLALIVNGKRNESSESFIKNYSGVEHIIYVNELNEINQETIKKEAEEFVKQWNEL